MLKVQHFKFLAAIVFVAVAFIFIQTVHADTVNTSVTVGNDAPSFTSGPAENPVSDGTTPTDVATDVIIEATADEPNSEDYYLIVCQTNSVSPTNGAAPTCPGGAWCVSTATSTGSPTSCTYSVPDSSQTESNDWYAFVCDGNATNAVCSASDQGSGASGSPFKVNNRPVFDAISNDGPVDPGGTVTFSTSAATTDPDVDTTADTVKLIVCKTSGLSAGACDGGAGDTWCESSLVANDPSCTANIDAVAQDGSQDAYVYLVDNHDLEASGGEHGQNSSFSINNVAPVVSSVTLNGGSSISLTEGTTTGVTITATVTDNNSCQDLNIVQTSLYRSGVTYTSCNSGPQADNNDCYPNVVCSIDVPTDDCTGSTDASAAYTCTVDVQYHADPTDANTQYPTENWLNTVYAEDILGLNDNTEVSTGVEMESLIGYDVTASINYGSLGAGDSNDPLDRITTIDSTGNVGLDVELSGTDMTDGGNTILVGNQEYSFTISTSYGSGTDLTSSPFEEEMNAAKTIITGSPVTTDLYWGLLVPGGTPTGTYTGTNTITAVKGETADW